MYVCICVECVFRLLPNEYSFQDLGQNCIIVDDWIKFGATRRVASLVQVCCLQLFLNRFIQHCTSGCVLAKQTFLKC